MDLRHSWPRANRSLPVFCLTLAASCAGPAPDGRAMAMFRGDSIHSGAYDATGFAAVGGLLWTFRTAGAIRSSPAVAGDLVFVGSADGHLYAVDRSTGRERWRFDAASPILSSPAVARGRVFFQDRAGSVHAVDALSGRQVWHFESGPEMPLPWGNEGWDYFTSSPVPAGGSLLVGAGDGNLYALDMESGAERWRHTTGGRIRSSPAVADSTAFVGSADGSVYAVDLASGMLRWRFDTEGRSLNSAEFGFDRRTVQSSPAVDDESVYVGARDGHLYAIGRASGELLWRFDHEVSWVISSPAVVDGVVYVGSSDGWFVQAVDTRSGHALWRAPTASNVFSSPAVVGGTVDVGDFTGAVLGLDRRTGEEVWRFGTGDAVLSSPAVQEGVLYVGSDDGRLYAFGGVADPVDAPRRAVFWDSTLAERSLYDGPETLRDALSSSGYEVVDAAGLAALMEESVGSGRRAVVVFAMDVLPGAVASEPSDTVLFRRFMAGSGRVLWPGYPPMAVVRDPETGRPTGLDMNRTTRLLGVPHDSATFDTYTATATAEGRSLGLPDWWIGRNGVDAADVTIVYATEERGRAVAWLKNYGGIPGSGFIRFWARRDPISDPAVVARLAESAWR